MRQETMEKLTQAVAGKLGIDAERLTVREVVKDNGIRLTGLAVTGVNIGPICYLNGYAEDLETGQLSYEEAAEEITKNLNYIPDDIRDKALHITGMSKEEFLSGIRIRLVEQVSNQETLEAYPHFPWCNLAGMFHYQIDNRASIRVTYDLMDRFGTSVTEMKDAGMKNVEKGATVQGMGEVMAAMTGQTIPDDGGNPLYVMSNTDKYFGANILLIPDPFEKLAEKLGDDLYILPSSRHEVLAVPKSIGDLAGMQAMVREVNRNEVSREDFLTDTVYEYTRGSGVIDIAA